MNVESRFLYCVFDNGEMHRALQGRVNPEWFDDPEFSQVWAYAQDYFANHQKTPTLDVIYRHFPTLELDRPAEPLSYYIEQMGKHRQNAIFEETLSDLRPLMMKEDLDAVEEIMDRLQAGLNKARNEVSPTLDVDLNETALARVIAYDNLVESGGLAGIPYGLSVIDDVTAGIHPSQLITFVGIQKSGKSTILLHSALNANEHGYKVLFISFEMSATEQGRRNDSIIAGVSHRRLMRGELTPEERDRYGDIVEHLEGREMFMVTEDTMNSTTISGLNAKIVQVDPDIVYVDGAYMMYDEEGGRSEREQLTNITRGLKRLAMKTGKPIVISTQALESKTKGGELTSYSIGYSSSFGQDSNVVIGVETPDEDFKALKRVKMLLSRDSELVETGVVIDYEGGGLRETALTYEDQLNFDPEVKNVEKENDFSPLPADVDDIDAAVRIKR